MFPTRLENLNQSLRSAGISALALNPGPSLVYLTGLHFHISERPVLAFFSPAAKPLIVLPELEMQKLADLPFEMDAVPYGENPAQWGGIFKKAIQSLRLEGRSVGVEPRSLRLLEYAYLQAVEGLQTPDASEVIGRLRVRKDAAEIACMRAAVEAAQTALEATLPLIKVGMTEKELAGELVAQLLRHGSEPELPFSPIVSTGPNSANPHAVPSGRKLQPGDLLVVDWGAASGGYISDLTRTFAVGEVEPQYRRIHEMVQEANAAGRAAGRVGAPCAEVDRAARAVIDAGSYGEYFTHRTGHGIGMESHEDPYMRGDNMQLLEPGMTYTVEPGIYLPGRNGVRIEDNMVVGPFNAESMSSMPRELRVVG